MIVPSARTTSKLITFSRIVPYLDIDGANQIKGGPEIGTDDKMKAVTSWIFLYVKMEDHLIVEMKI